MKARWHIFSALSLQNCEKNNPLCHQLCINFQKVGTNLSIELSTICFIFSQRFDAKLSSSSGDCFSFKMLFKFFIEVVELHLQLINYSITIKRNDWMRFLIWSFPNFTLNLKQFSRKEERRYQTCVFGWLTSILWCQKSAAFYQKM